MRLYLDWSPEDMVSGSTTLPGYVPSKLGTADLGWETTRTLNVGLDYWYFEK